MKQKRGLDMLKMLMMFGVLPTLAVTIILTIVASSTASTEVESLTYEKLETANVAFNDYIKRVIAEEGDGMLTGEVKDYSYIDGFKNLNLELTLFGGPNGDTRMLTSLKDASGSRIEGTQASSGVISSVLGSGAHFSSDNIDIAGRKYYVDYLPLSIDGKTVGMTFVGESMDNVEKVEKETVMKLLLISIAVVVVCIIIIILFALKIRKSSVEIANSMQIIATGDLSTPVTATSAIYENRLMIESMKKMQETLHNTVSDIRGNSSTLSDDVGEVKGLSQQSADSAGQISQAVDDLAQGAMSMAESVENVNGKILEMGNKVVEIGENVNALNGNAEKMRSVSQDASSSMDLVLNSSNSTVASVDNINKQILLTNDSINKINDAINLIISIANQTQLLSLNASIEAARAGEAGRGFAVVATNISELSEQSNEGASTIRAIAEEILKNSEDSVRLSEAIKNAISEEQNAIIEAQGKFEDLEAAIGDSVEEIKSIGEKTEALEQIKSSIVADVQDLSAISEENAASTEEVTASVQSIAANVSMIAERMGTLDGVSNDLNGNVAFFK